MMKKNIYTNVFVTSNLFRGLALISLFFVIPHFVDAYTFTRTLSIGSRGEDVLELQKFLNTNPLTQVAVDGPGSSGNETSQFGTLTRNAVIKLQVLFAEEILTPLGLSEGTGFVGQSTLNFLNKTRTQQDEEEVEDLVKLKEETDSKKEETLTERGEANFFVSKTILRRKEKLYIGSDVNLKELDVYIGDRQVQKNCQHSVHTCGIDVQVDPGVHKIRTSNPDLGYHTITVLPQNTPKPQVDIKTLSLSEDNIIRGKNFSDNIKIFTMFGVFESETKDNAFILRFPKEYVKDVEKDTEGLFYIQNSNGITTQGKQITYEK